MNLYKHKNCSYVLSLFPKHKSDDGEKKVVIEVKLASPVHFYDFVSSYYSATHNLPLYCNLDLSNYTIIIEVMRK